MKINGFDQIVVAGGSDATGTGLNTMESIITLHIELQSWREMLPALPYAIPKVQFCLVDTEGIVPYSLDIVIVHI